jgi:Spy/CpxP family protein refolding chaperone
MSTTISRTARVALLISLALNVALLAVLWMHAPWNDDRSERRGGHRSGPIQQLFDVRALKRSLPPERQQVINQAIEGRRDTLRAGLAELFDARREVRTAIQAQPYDRASLESAFSRLRAAEDATAAQAQAMLGDVLDAITPDERAELAKLIARRAPRRHDSSHGRERPDERDVPKN